MPRLRLNSALVGLITKVADSTDVVAEFVTLSEQMVERFAAPGGLDGVVAHPAGDFLARCS